MADEKKLRVRFLRDAVADHRDFLAGQEASIPFDDAQLLAADWRVPGGQGAGGRSPSVKILPSV